MNNLVIWRLNPRLLILDESLSWLFREITPAPHCDWETHTHTSLDGVPHLDGGLKNTVYSAGIKRTFWKMFFLSLENIFQTKMERTRNWPKWIQRVKAVVLESQLWTCNWHTTTYSHARLGALLQDGVCVCACVLQIDVCVSVDRLSLFRPVLTLSP
jgi:hypothetical protein